MCGGGEAQESEAKKFFEDFFCFETSCWRRNSIELQSSGPSVDELYLRLSESLWGDFLRNICNSIFMFAGSVPGVKAAKLKLVKV